MVDIKKQHLFPYIEEYRQQFPITDGTIFVFDKTIYTNNEIPYDILHHELEHLRHQQEVTPKLWIDRYLKDKDFRLEAELRAYRLQLEKVKEQGDKEELFNITDECANNLSSKLYGGIISKRSALKLLKE